MPAKDKSSTLLFSSSSDPFFFPNIQLNIDIGYYLNGSFSDSTNAASMTFIFPQKSE